MGTITLPNTFSSGTTALSAEVNSNFSTIYNEFNGSISNANISGSAAIADTKLAQITTGGKVSVTALTVASQAQGDVLYYNGTNWTRLAAGTDGQLLETNGAGANPQWTSFDDLVSDGFAVDSTYVQTVAATTHATALPIDDTQPTNSEGNEIGNLDISHTAASSTNKIYFDLNLNASSAAGQGAAFGVTLLDGTTVIAVAGGTIINNGTIQQNNFRYEYTPGDTSSHTYHFRIGNAAGSTFTVNGQSGSRIFGGLLVSSVTITEVKAS